MASACFCLTHGSRQTPSSFSRTLRPRSVLRRCMASNGLLGSGQDFEHHINTLELFPIVLAAEIWGPNLANHRVTFLSDNSATVAVLNSQSSRCPAMMRLIRRLVLAALKYNILFLAKTIYLFINTTLLLAKKTFVCIPLQNNI